MSIAAGASRSIRSLGIRLALAALATVPALAGAGAPPEKPRAAPAPATPAIDPSGATLRFSRAPRPSSPLGAAPAPRARRIGTEGGTTTITHSASQAILAGNSVSCNSGGQHGDNSYIRRFELGAFGITNDFDVTEVVVGVEQALGTGGSQPVTVNLYTWDPAETFTFANFVPIGSAPAAVPDQSLTLLTVPVTGTAPAGATLVVELFTPDGQVAGHSFFVGSNNAGQTAPSFLAAADCGLAEPTDLGTIGFPDMHIVMLVTGVEQGAPLAICAQPNLAIPDDDPTGVFDDLVVPNTGVLGDLDLSLAATHTWVGDLVFTLTHVDTGTAVTVYDRPGVPASTFGCGGDDVDAAVNDEGADGDLETQCDDLPAIHGDVVGGDPPNAALLAAFDGEDLAGTWRLTASDRAGGDTGTLTDWCLLATVPVPEVALTKTVGTVPGVCAATDEITVITGTPVYYCYHVENTGEVDFAFHTLVDDQLGLLLDNEPIALPVGASYDHIVPDVADAPVTNLATWTAADNPGGYTVDDTIPFDFEDISTTGTPLSLADDEVSAAIPIGFPFQFFGTGYHNVYVSSNGFLTLLVGQDDGCCTGLPIPTPGNPDGLLAGWWEDLNPGAGGQIDYQLLGSAPNRRFVVQLTAVPHFPSGNEVTLQYKLFEGAGVAEVHYQAAPSDGEQHSAGAENFDGTLGEQYFLGTGGLPTPLGLRYTPLTTRSATSPIATATVILADPNIVVSPPSLSSTLEPGQLETQQLALQNTGLAGLDWTLAEAPAAGACNDPVDLPWVSVDPTSGTTNPGGTATIDVTFDSTGLTPGSYTGTLCVSSNDPDTSLVEVALALTVNDTMPFLDGFETGDTSRWSSTVP